MRERCENCQFWTGSKSPAQRCRRRPPVIVVGMTYGQWPMTADNDWCGEFQWVKDDWKSSHE